MAVFVDTLMNHGWVLRGHRVRSCHLFTDLVDLAELHALAAKIGMKPSWFQPQSSPHYDLTEKRRAAAVIAGAVEVDRRTAVALWRIRRQLAKEPG